MNVAGVLLLRFMGSLEYSAEAQAAYAVCYTELFSFITWTSVGLMGAAAAIAGQNLGAGHPDRSMQAVQVAARVRPDDRRHDRRALPAVPRAAARVFGLTDPTVVRSGASCCATWRVGPLHHRRADLYGRAPGHGGHRSPLFITLVSQVVVPLGLCFTVQAVRGR